MDKFRKLRRLREVRKRRKLIGCMEWCAGLSVLRSPVKYVNYRVSMNKGFNNKSYLAEMTKTCKFFRILIIRRFMVSCGRSNARTLSNKSKMARKSIWIIISPAAAWARPRVNFPISSEWPEKVYDK